MDKHSIHQWLAHKHISVPLEWVQECVHFLRSEGITPNEIPDSVYEQWLVGDLAVLEECVLDNAICNGNQFIGTHALQVNYAIDISQSMYSQVRSLLGRSCGNLEVQEMEEPATRWEPKASRCMMLEITDGVRRMKAVEQETIAALNYAWNPGTKVVLKGPIRCVGNCLMLTKGSITILGGLVEELVENFKSEKILQEILMQATTVNKENCSRRFPNPGKIGGKKHEAKVEIKPAKSEYKQTTQLPEWDEDVSDSEFLADQNVAAGDCSFNSDWLPPESANITPKHNSTRLGQKTEGLDGLTWSDDDMLEETDKPKLEPLQQFSLKSPSRCKEDGNSETMLWSDDVELPDDDFMDDGETVRRNDQLRGHNHKTLSKVNIPDLHKNLQGVDNSLSTCNQVNQCKDNGHRVDSDKKNDSIIDLLSSDDEDESIDTRLLQKHHQCVTPQLPSKDNVTQPVELMLQQEVEPYSIKEARVSDTPTVTSSNECSESHKCQFQYLSQLSPSSELTTIVVKGHVSTVLDKLGRSADKASWTLNVRINDGTAFLDCLISHKLIESHIGQVKETIRRSKANITDRRIVVQKMKNFADWLASANGMMHIDVRNFVKPVLLDIHQPTQNDLKLFQMCLARK